jgi:hypothetical protein
MKITDIAFGESLLIELETEMAWNPLPAPGDFSGCEVSSAKVLPGSGEVVIGCGDSVISARGYSGKDRAALERLESTFLDKIIYIQSDRSFEPGEPGRLVLEARIYMRGYQMNREFKIGVDEKILDNVRGQLQQQDVDMEAACDWLKEEFLLPDCDTESNCSRAFISADPNPHGFSGDYRIYGRNVVADVRRDPSGAQIIDKIVKSGSARKNLGTRSIQILSAPFDFVHIDAASNSNATEQAELKAFIESEDSYLNLWIKYNDIERRNSIQEAIRFGWVRYQNSATDERNDLELEVDFNRVKPEIRSNFERLMNQSDSLLEISRKLPDALVSEEHDDSDSGQRSRGKGSRPIFGTLIRIDMESGGKGRLVLETESELSDLPRTGFVSLSLSGTLTSLNRRESARNRITSEKAAMRNLDAILVGKDARVRRLSRRSGPLSKGAREKFRGEPTPKQIEAIDIALNTPDIAIIQGPPGTGKTRTIAAIQQRLSEMRDASGDVSGRFLITSFQHEAVENVASAASVFNLPVPKLGKKHGQKVNDGNLERWRNDAKIYIQAQLADFPDASVAIAHQRLLGLFAGYLQQPENRPGTLRLLQKVQSESEELLPADLLVSLKTLIAEYSSQEAPVSAMVPENGMLLRLIRRLRIDETSFSDDGQRSARLLLTCLQQHDEVTGKLLKVASEDPKFSDFDGLSKVQDELLLKYTISDSSEGVGQADPSVLAFLESAIEALQKRKQREPAGLKDALQDYLEDLEYDPDYVRETIKDYSMVLSATCQQTLGREMVARKGDLPLFDTVIVDEAARANPLDLMIPMSQAENKIVLVGDHRQLPHLLEQSIERELVGNSETDSQLRESLFHKLFEELKQRQRVDQVQRVVTLDQQFRMHPILGDFVSQVFYEPYGEGFKAGLDESHFSLDLKGYQGTVATWWDVSRDAGAETRGRSKSRDEEAKVIAAEVKRIVDLDPDLSVGVISFYRKQVDLIMDRMVEEGLAITDESEQYQIHPDYRNTTGGDNETRERLRVGTVDSFQGKEFDIVFLSAVRSNSIQGNSIQALRKKFGHLTTENRLCVAMSRQKCHLVVVGDQQMFSDDLAKEHVHGLWRFNELCSSQEGRVIHD